jgi:hypothetical protein
LFVGITVVEAAAAAPVADANVVVVRVVWLCNSRN